MCVEVINGMADTIVELEQKLAKLEWIPVTERLPKRGELVLVTYKTTNKIHLCKYFDDDSKNSWWSYVDDCCVWNDEVIAWMPLPKPYEKGENNVKD